MLSSSWLAATLIKATRRSARKQTALRHTWRLSPIIMLAGREIRQEILSLYNARYALETELGPGLLASLVVLPEMDCIGGICRTTRACAIS